VPHYNKITLDDLRSYDRLNKMTVNFNVVEKQVKLGGKLLQACSSVDDPGDWTAVYIRHSNGDIEQVAFSGISHKKA